MRVFEAIQLGLVGAAILLPVVAGRRLRRGRVSVALVAAAVAQLVIEGYRWQLLPLEVATVLLVAGDLIWDERRVRGFARFRRATLGAAGLVAVGFLPVALPVPELPDPGGRFEIGTATFVLVDGDREEIYGPGGTARATASEPAEPGGGPGDEEQQTGDPRRIVAQVWYPASPAEDARPEVWNPDLDVVGPAIAEHLGFPGFFLNHTSAVASHSVRDAPPLEGEFPVVLSSHGWGGFRTINIHQIESLASRGFMVISPDHTFASIATRLGQDGPVRALDAAALPQIEEVGVEDHTEAAELLVETMAEDLLLILDELDAGPGGGFGELADQADTTRVGMFGHSTGGGAAVRACIVDARCGAVAGLDAWVEPIPDRIVASEVQVPAMWIRSDGWRDTPNDRRLRGQAERSPSEAYWIGIEGAAHQDFVIAPLISPIADRFGLAGSVPADRVIPIVDGYLVSFFERHLLGLGGTALDQSPPSEVELEHIP